ANRSSVVVYSVDAKGLQTLMPDASTGGVPRPEDFQRVAQENFDSQEGLTYIARETGGLAFLNNNDLNFGIRKALDDTRSYYLLGFDPDNEKFDRKYHSIKLKVTRPGLRVRTRAGFIGVPERERRQQQQLAGPEARSQQILGALFSPFGARELSLQMTSFFFNAQKEGSFVRSLYHIDPERLTFKDDPQQPGIKVMTLEIVSFSFNESGAVIDQHGRSITLNFDEERLKIAMAKGLIYTDDFLLKKPGAYQFRTVLRDPESGRLGSASQFIQVPDLTKKRLALSGLIIASSEEQKTAGAAKPETSDVNLSPAVRRFPRGGVLDYGSAIYNAQLDAAGKPNLMMQVEIYQDGKAIYQSQPRLVESTMINGRLDCGGRLALATLPPGEYTLHLIVTDTQAKSKYARADQWMDFGIR
ncbi:MAG: VWA domain-containing protein, partial [Acidobacteriota bacterium]